VAGATMLARSLSNAEHQDFGYQVPGRVEVSLQPAPADYSHSRLDQLNRELLVHAKQLPGVYGAGVTMYNPLTANWGGLVLVQGRQAPKFGEQAGASWSRVTPEYLRVLGQTLLRGRSFTDADNETSDPVAIVNEDFVRRFFPNEDPIDKRFGFDMPENAS